MVGNLKVSSFFRSVGSTASTWKHIDFRQHFKMAPAAFLGTAIGAASIAHLSSKWLLPAITIAVAVTVLAPKIANKITPRTFLATTFLTGLYAGILGAGIGVILIALMRIQYPKDSDIAHVKIQARFFEFLLVMVSIPIHMANQNLLASVWVPLSLGTSIGGYIGGLLLRKMGTLSSKTQKYILYTAFVVDFVVAGVKFFGF